MKKFLMGLFVLVVASTVAMAGVGIQWSIQYGAYDHDSPDVVGSSTPLLDNYSSLWQLIYAGADNAADAIDDPMDRMDPVAWAANDYLYPGGDDAVWAERTLVLSGGIATAPEDGTSWDNWMLYGGGTVVYEDLAWSTAGYVYQRVFESITPDANTYFYETSLMYFDGTYSGGGAPTQEFYVDNFDSGFQPNTQPAVVPEPATMGLLGLGALVMAIRRRRA